MELRGEAVYSGQAEGEPVLLDEMKGELPEDVDGKIGIVVRVPMEKTYILTKLKGMVIVRGGILSHVAIIARELGIPSVLLRGVDVNQLLSANRIKVVGDKIILQRGD